MFSPSVSSTRASSLIALLVLASSISARTPEYRLQCLSTGSSETTGIASCGDKNWIASCLGNLQTTASEALLSQVETCFLKAGCDEAEAGTEAAKALTRCDSAQDGADLRKRGGVVEGRDTTQSAPATVAPVTTAAAATNRAVVRAAATTTRPLGLAHSGRPIVCYTTSLQTVNVCPVQSTGPSSGHVLSCFPTMVPTSACAPGLICVKDSDGNPSCMFAYNGFDAAGIAVATFFAAAVASAVALIATLCYREKRARKRAEAATLAAEAKMLKEEDRDRDEAAGASVAGVRRGPGGDPGRPLMHGDVGGDDHGAGYAGGLQQGASPFGDQHRVR